MKHIGIKALLILLSLPFFISIGVVATSATAFADCTTVDASGNVVPCTNTTVGSGSTVTSGVDATGGGTQGSVSASGGGVQSGNTQGRGEITNPLSGINSVSDFIQKLLKAVVQIGVPIAVLFIILSGFKFIMAQGNSEELATARKNFVHVVIGVAIFIGAWALAELIVSTLRSIGINV